MTAVEIIALIFVALSVIKLVVLSISPRAWYGPANPIIRLVWNRISATVLSLVLGGLVLFYLLAEISIVQIFASMVFTFLLVILIMAPDIKKIFDVLIRHLEREKRLWTRYWFPLLVWIALMVWVVWEIFT